jgi:hypothetical protein
MLSAQSVRISEFMAANNTIYPDNHDFDDYSDWIELENTTGAPIDLSNYFLSDDPTLPLRWHIPSGTVIPANGFLVIRADGFNAAPGETHRRDSAPWDNFQTTRHHTNFKLDSIGESVVLTELDTPAQNTTYLALGDSWKYFDQGSLPAANWHTSAYNDTTWPNGNSELGYGDGDENTVVSYGPSDAQKYPTTYFRTTFNVTDPSAIGELNCRAKIDDGAVLYINGTEVGRPRMGSGTISYETLSQSSASESTFDDIIIPIGTIVTGTNVIAVEVHQRSQSSSDISLNVEITAVEFSGSPTTIDSVTYGPQVDDISYGRNPANGGNWTYFGDPTPNAANTSFPSANRSASGGLSVSPAGGFYSGTQNVVLSTGAVGATIRYTLDGSVPSSTSTAYAGPIAIPATRVLRARTFEAGMVPGALETHTYFIDEPLSPLPVVGFTVEPDKFFDNDLGIYENVYKGREASNSVEFYAPDRSPAFKVNSGTKIGGENIWRFAQKPLNIAMRGKYGDDLINYHFFPSEPFGNFDAIGFRNGGDNWNDAMLRDPMSPSIVRGQMNNDVAWYRPVVLYLNGAYWGIHNARLRMGDSYFAQRYQIQPGGFDLLVKEHAPPSGDTELVVKDGDSDAYLAFETYVDSTDMTVQANYDAAVAQMDLDNFMDYCALVDFVYESSWHHNQEFWRERKSGAKWKWNINDIDRGFSGSRVTSSLIDDLKSRHPIFDSLRRNTGFKNRFVQRYAAHMSSTFHPDRIADIIDGLAAEVDPEIPRHIARWDADGGFSASKRDSEIAEVKQFAIDRASNVFGDMARHLGISNTTANLAITVSPANGGSVLLNNVPLLPSYSTSVELYQNIAFDLTATPAPGYVFSGWSIGNGNSTISQSLTGNSSITSNFTLSGETFIASTISNPTTLTTAGSPYVASGDIVVDPGVTLNVDPGVTIRMPSGASIYVGGVLNFNGTALAPITIEPQIGAGRWGAIGFTNATGTSTLSHFVLAGATLAAKDPVNLKAAISALNSNIVIEFGDISAPFPVFARGGSTTVRFTQIHPEFTGDGINIKSGAGLVEDCTFLGNREPDTDAIDFDNVVNGVIQRNRICAFLGFNSDGIDIGEGCVNLLLSENRIYNVSDKGVSVGQGSVVNMYRNLIVGCSQGVGVKDAGSTVNIDQNTFSGNRVGVASFEKNLNRGGGTANISNTIFSRSKDADATVDSLSTLTVSYSLSDTLALPAGTGNLVGDPLFADSSNYDFSLLAGSPAFDSGDPAHALDPDSSRADMGAYYVYDPNDYPFQVPSSVVINEILAHSSGLDGDWIEIYNRSNSPVDIGGWFLSDSGSNLEKYRIADGTTIGVNSYLVFTQALHFGASSVDPGTLISFALSENGETAYLFGPSDGLFLDYIEAESFGPSASDVTKGLHFKASTNTFNFVAMAAPTPGTANSFPLVGPIVISEIMYHPTTGNAEYFELLNISAAPVVLYDALKNESWHVTDGVVYSFPIGSPVTMQPGERILLAENQAVLQSVFAVPPGVQIFDWTSGGLRNSGEKLELSSPGDIDGMGIRQFIRRDRVVFETNAPWPSEPDLGLHSLTRIANASYGNDPANWTASLPTPGYATQSGFQIWAASAGLPAGMDGPHDDFDNDFRSNFNEYATGTDPTLAEGEPLGAAQLNGNQVDVSFQIARNRPELTFTIERSPDLTLGSWTAVPTSLSPLNATTELLTTTGPYMPPRMFYRMVIYGE